MATIKIEISDDVMAELERIAALCGVSKAHIVREALFDKMEELEDFQVVRARLSKPFKTIPNDDVWAGLNIAG